MTSFGTTTAVADALAGTGYLTDDRIATVVFLAEALGKPVLVEGPAGVGKTELAKAIAEARAARLVRLQCYEGLDEARALYEWDYRKQLLRIQHQAAAGEGAAWDAVRDDIFSHDYLLERPLLQAISSAEDTVLLVDEIDKADFEFEALLLEILGELQVTIPELGTISAAGRPYVVLTSNSTRELSEALKRRCLYLHLDYPDPEREQAIIRSRVPEASAAMAAQLARLMHSLRQLELRKPPSISETIDWARTLVALGHEELDEAVAQATVSVALKHQSDVEKALGHLTGGTSGSRG